ncbi:MAG: aspartate-semialdehyde dehydrogenase [Firmicutes bacterium]|nr:aspartate-semialdehyde dehydrogenase [Bacillota bacterium]
MKKLKVGIIGATGMVGQKLVEILSDHPWFEVCVLAAGERSQGKTYEEAMKNKWNSKNELHEKFRSKIIFNSIEDCEKICSMVNFVFCAVNLEEKKTRELEYKYAKMECPVISNNSAHRWTDDVPILIPEINGDHAKIINFQRKRLGTKIGFISVKPNCSIQCFLPALYPLKKFGIKIVVVSTYQSISGAGKTFEQFSEIKDNIIPFIEGEEEKTELEPLKILGTLHENRIINTDISIISSCVRVPVSNGHMATVFVKFNEDVEIDNIIKIWKSFNPINLPSSPKRYIKYFYDNDRPQVKLDRNLYNGMGISVGRIKKESNGIRFICISNNTIRGAAGGSVLSAEFLYKEGYLNG